MYGIYVSTYILLIFMVNVGKYTVCPMDPLGYTSIIGSWSYKKFRPPENGNPGKLSSMVPGVWEFFCGGISSVVLAFGAFEGLRTLGWNLIRGAKHKFNQDSRCDLCKGKYFTYFTRSPPKKEI